MLSETQTKVLLGYAIIMNSSRPWSWVTRDDIRAAFVTRGFRSWYEVCVLPDYIGFGDDWEAYGRGQTIQEAYQNALEACQRHHRYQEWMNDTHEAMEFGGEYIPPADMTEEPDVFAPAKLPSNTTRIYFFDHIREFTGQSRKHHKRYQRRYVRREVKTQLRTAA